MHNHILYLVEKIEITFDAELVYDSELGALRLLNYKTTPNSIRYDDLLFNFLKCFWMLKLRVGISRLAIIRLVAACHVNNVLVL